MKKYAVIVAAGSGTRMGKEIPKQFLQLNGKAILLYSIDAFLLADPDFRIILVVHPDYFNTTMTLINTAGLEMRVKIVPGGKTRSESVKAGLDLVPDEAIVLVHDAARCLVTSNLISRCCDLAEEIGSAIPVVRVTDSVRMISKRGSEPLDRELLRLVQTPQAFQARLLKKAYEKTVGKAFSDDASVLEACGIPINLIDGEAINIKITRPPDLKLAAYLLKQANV